MSHGRSLCFSLCVTAGLLVTSLGHAADPAMQVTKPIYPWRTETQKTADKKQFSHCLVKNMYDNGILLLIAENAEHQHISRQPDIITLYMRQNAKRNTKTRRAQHQRAFKPNQPHSGE